MSSGQPIPIREKSFEVSHRTQGPGDVLEVWIEDLLLFEQQNPPIDIGTYVSVGKQQSVLWRSTDHEFKIVDLAKIKGGPEQPFYREFSKQTAVVDLYSHQVSSGPPRLDANPGPGKEFAYKATIELKGGKVIDPHIMTVE